MERQRLELWGGWSLVLPSPCQVTRNQDGSWSAWDESHVVDVSIIEVGGGHNGAPMQPEEMITGSEGWAEVHYDGALVRTSTDVEVTQTAIGPEPIEWTRVHAGATNTSLIMSIGNGGLRDAAWHERLWKSVRHTPPKKGILDRLRRS